jgi:hypothetical protein
MATTAQNVLIGEYVIALGVASWGAIKAQQAPWPPTVVKSSLAFGILGIAALGSPELAATLGAGFLLAQLLRVLNNQPPYTGGVPDVTRDPDDGKHYASLDIAGTTVNGLRTILSWK